MPRAKSHRTDMNYSVALFYQNSVFVILHYFYVYVHYGSSYLHIALLEIHFELISILPGLVNIDCCLPVTAVCQPLLSLLSASQSNSNKGLHGAFNSWRCVDWAQLGTKWQKLSGIKKNVCACKMTEIGWSRKAEHGYIFALSLGPRLHLPIHGQHPLPRLAPSWPFLSPQISCTLLVSLLSDFFAWGFDGPPLNLIIATLPHFLQLLSLSPNHVQSDWAFQLVNILSWLSN